MVNNGLGNYQTAMSAAQRATEHPEEMLSPTWAAVELIEAAARSGKTTLQPRPLAGWPRLRVPAAPIGRLASGPVAGAAE